MSSLADFVILILFTGLGFIGGVLVGRHNVKTVNKVVTEADTIEADANKVKTTVKTL